MNKFEWNDTSKLEIYCWDSNGNFVDRYVNFEKYSELKEVYDILSNEGLFPSIVEIKTTHNFVKVDFEKAISENDKI